MLKQRLFTALILIPVFIALLFKLPPKHFCILTGALLLLGAWEWSGLMGFTSFLKKLIYPILVFFIMMATLILMYEALLSVKTILYVTLGFWISAFALVICYPKIQFLWHSLLIKALMGVLVLVPCWIALNFIRIFPEGTFTLLFLFCLIWGADSGAYFAGKKWGKHKLLPAVSPGKTWEGLMGALIATVLIVFVFTYMMHFNQLVKLMILSFITVLFSILGDLFESMLKRQQGLKDSGTFLPGHGGVLDRIDSLTAAAPIFALGVMILSTYS